MRMSLTKTVFSAEECRQFGHASGDLNPLHVDELYARRSMAGRCVVHGVFVLLRALDLAFANGVQKPSRINAEFRKFICVDEEVDFGLFRKDATGVEVTASVGSTPRAEISLRFSHARSDDRFLDAPSECPVAAVVHGVALDEPPSHHLGKVYEIDLHRFGTLNQFAHCSRTIGDMPTRAFCAATYFVGMVCPGLNSIFSSLDVEVLPNVPNPSVQNFRLDRFDERVGRFEIVAHGVLTGKITAFARPSLVTPEHISSYEGKVESGEFSDVSALIVGGSRGLGAAAAKILSLGGAGVTITFSRGASEAAAVADEIESFGLAKPRTAAFDVLHDGMTAIHDCIAAANTVLYFATPRIRAGAPRVVDKRLFDDFYQFYVEKLWELCLYIESLRQPRKVIYVPSSTFVQTGSKAYLEYAMAKAAAEAMCAEINHSLNRVRAVTTRLPQLKTDQTASLFDLKYESIFENVYFALKAIARQH